MCSGAVFCCVLKPLNRRASQPGCGVHFRRLTLSPRAAPAGNCFSKTLVSGPEGMDAWPGRRGGQGMQRGVQRGRGQGGKKGGAMTSPTPGGIRPERDGTGQANRKPRKARAQGPDPAGARHKAKHLEVRPPHLLKDTTVWKPQTRGRGAHPRGGSGWAQHPGWPGFGSGHHRFQHPAPGFESGPTPVSASGPRIRIWPTPVSASAPRIRIRPPTIKVEKTSTKQMNRRQDKNTAKRNHSLRIKES